MRLILDYSVALFSGWSSMATTALDGLNGRPASSVLSHSSVWLSGGDDKVADAAVDGLTRWQLKTVVSAVVVSSFTV